MVYLCIYNPTLALLNGMMYEQASNLDVQQLSLTLKQHVFKIIIY
jgi:hypothetical protein